MAQQTINVGTAPNDGTGTPLRTAFQYTNSNFSELYTAVGPSGNNITVPGAATITGDLTVDTSTLKVDSGNDRVGVGTASPTSKLHVSNTGAVTRITITDDTTNGRSGYIESNFLDALVIGTTSGVRAIRFSPDNKPYYQIATDGVQTWLDGIGGTRMTLNATGLGVGVASPAYKLDVNGVINTSSDIYALGGRFALYRSAGSSYIDWSSGQSLIFRTVTSAGGAGASTIATIDTSGNVGIGVTPSAWSSMLALQVRGASLVCDSTIHRARLLTNAFYDGAGYKYIQTNFASMYVQNSLDGSQSWFTAPSGTAGTAITFTQAMTLDASGNLLVGTTNTSSTAGVGFKSQFSSTVPQFAIVVNEAGTSTNFSIYNVNAAAYRFYVNNGGTVFATNTTISAISDARLKENVQDIDVGLGAILALKPRKFDWKAGKGKDIKGDRGFIAQEFETVFPNLIDEWKDAAPEGEAPYKSVRQDLIPVLVKAIQELAAEVNALKNV